MVSTAAGNLANLNTTSYKSIRLDLGTLGAASQPGGDVGQGAQVLSTSRDFSSGALVNTGNEWDLAIQGNGFFKVRQGNQDVYTRDGSFRLDQDRYLVDAQGNRLQPDLQLPQGTASIRVDGNGHLTALDASGDTLASADIPYPPSPTLKACRVLAIMIICPLRLPAPLWTRPRGPEAPAP